MTESYSAIDSFTATCIIIGFLVIFGIILPILDKVPKVKNFVSLRWTIVVVYSAICIGVIIDFEHLDQSVRFAVVVGGIILSAIFLLVRSIEKAFVNNWSIPHARASLQKGDVSAELSVSSKTAYNLRHNEKEKNKQQTEEKKEAKQKKQEELSNYINEKQKEKDYERELDKSLLLTEQLNKTKDL